MRGAYLTSTIPARLAYTAPTEASIDELPFAVITTETQRARSVRAIMGLTAPWHTSAPAFPALKYLSVAYLLYTAKNAPREQGAQNLEELSCYTVTLSKVSPTELRLRQQPSLE